MKINEINKILLDPKMQNKNTNFKIIADGCKKPTIADVLTQMHQGFAQINSRIDKLDNRIDKLENLVVGQFKQHKWIK